MRTKKKMAKNPDRMKTCSRCGICKAKSEFHRNRTRMDGLSSWCRACVRKKEKAYYRKHKERRLAESKKWAEENPERIREIDRARSHRRRVLLRSRSGYWYLSPPQIGTIFRRDGGQCLACGAQDDLEIDHIRPVTRGGDNSFSNLQTLCAKCNNSKGQSTVDYRRDANGIPGHPIQMRMSLEA